MVNSPPSISDAEVLDYGVKLYDETYNSFFAFVEKVFSVAIKNKYGSFVSGNYIKESCEFLQNNKRTIYLSSRAHFKSFRFYCYIAWLIWKNKRDKKNINIAYISFNQDLAAMHVSKIKELINKSFFNSMGLYDEDSTATSKAKYMWLESGDNKSEIPHIEINCYGALGGLRGGHPTHTFLDDIYTDSNAKNVISLEPEIVRKINSIFKKVILPMPLFDGELHIIGTPQSYADIWFNPDYKKKSPGETLKFEVKIQPAYTNWDYESKSYIEGIKKEAIWPEMFPLEKLEEQESMVGKSEFMQEYLCTPKSSAESFFEQERIDKSMEYGREVGLFNYDDGHIGFKKFDKEDFIGHKIVAGFDPGKDKHPSHFVVFAYKDGVLSQILSKWMDSWPYSYTEEGKPSQLKYISDAVRHFGISKIYADNTNSVLTTTIERNEIPGIVDLRISHSLKGKMAVSLQKHIGKPEFKLLSDDRQKRSLLAVQVGGLKIVETKDSHGESFTSLSFVTLHTLDKGVGDQERRITIRTEKERLPKLYKGYFFESSSIQRKDLSFLQNSYNKMRRLM